ncbi:MAG: hypothetical protein UIJ82_06305 [Collinsella sp.]|nr:hypothetical protein [Collinsella sp.]
MITLWEMLRNKEADPAAGRPLDLTRIYMANVMSHGEAALLAKRQELHDREEREAQRADLYKKVAAIAGGEEPKGDEPKGEEPEPGYVKSEPTGAKELGQQALGFPPLDGTGGTAEEAEAAINAILSEERKRETF